ncbi:delta-1-pyrroline-5-carboxylate dehydrogenase, mitochondrial [Drosophila gunungcola]|uniref:delta-1-pyrroline-5-carboxylate dehydrogenase, mitochondrial n=1 Tax=Drosophila gunungcola TaxID=103775 RepID=UPI0022E7D02B|nr:delta-1-pyrroline-5-carboxylate dehydrogenase, mitochondrial [Drosophila gunungcola]
MMSKVAHGIVSNMRSILPRLEASVKGGLLAVRSTSKNTLLTEHFTLDEQVVNEELLQYEEGSVERTALENALLGVLNKVEKVPIVINGQEFQAKEELQQVLPYKIQQPIAHYGHAHRVLIQMAIDKSLEAQVKWDKTKLSERIDIWERAAELIAGKHRYNIMAATMLGQGKTLRQAETDVAELVDFMRINPVFLRELANYEPINGALQDCRNSMRLRGLSGFVAAISPFNFTGIAGNLAYTPALMGNSVLWKPSDSAILSNYFVFKAMQEAGVPHGVVNFVPAEEMTFASVITQHPKLAGINFTGTSNVLKVLWQLVAQNINFYENYPRLVGEGGGKNFHFVHPSADPEMAVACTIRAAFEYSGQKCSSCSMLYVPESLWADHIRQPLLKVTSSLFVGHATDCDCFCSAVINRRAYDRIYMWLRYILQSPSCQLLIGGTCDKQNGYFVDPTVVQVKDLDNIICREELLAPILGVYVYRDDKLRETMTKVAEINHGLAGSVFAKDQIFIQEAYEAFRFNVGNLNVNDKSTGSMVGQQPFGAGHMTGTSDKLGTPHCLLRWTSPQVIKESYKPHVNIYYPYMQITEQNQGIIPLESEQKEAVAQNNSSFVASSEEDKRPI